MEERRMIANIVHRWRTAVQAHTLLQQLPQHYDWFHERLVLRPLFLTPEGDVVVLLKVSAMCAGSCAAAPVIVGRAAAPNDEHSRKPHAPALVRSWRRCPPCTAR
jgi:hypothetical protein